MTDEKCVCLEHEDIGCGYRHLRLKARDIAASAQPGQFVHLRVPSLEKSALRRPFSIYNAQGDCLELLYKEVGRGTNAMRTIAAGDELNVLGPLGHGFPVKCEGEALLVGGGFGVAPLYFLARKLKDGGQCGAISLFVGGRTKDDLLALDRFAELGVAVHAATNDGSVGTKGLVTDPLDDALAELREKRKSFEIFACGPDGMLKAVAWRATGTGAKGWISMDRHMVCGIGACYACVQKTVRGQSRCCIEGPVFRADDLIWE